MLYILTCLDEQFQLFFLSIKTPFATSLRSFTVLLFALGEALKSNTLAANLEETDDSIMRNEVKFFFKSKK